MALPSFLKRKTPAAPAPDDAVVVQRARTVARRRLIGAAVLLAIGVIAFPLLFETQPRPIPVDIPIEIPRKDGQPPLQLPAKAPRMAAGTVADTGARAVNEPAVAASAAAATLPVAPLPTSASAPPAATAAPPKPVAPAQAGSAAAPKPAAAKDAAAKEPAAKEAAAKGQGTSKDATAKPIEAATRPASAAARPTAAEPAASGGRFVVQVGAFADVTAAREARAKVERLGLKTYTQVVETPQGKRIRVRVGPFDSQDEAGKVLARLKAAKLPGAVLTL